MKRTMAYIAPLAVVAASLVSPAAASANPTGIDLQPESVQQTIDGFGYSAAFQRTALLEQLSEPQRTEALDLLLGADGAAPSILRLGIGGQSVDTYDVMLSIQPTDPGGPDAEPNYQWDGWDNGQLWFAQAAAERGVEYMYGNAWTAPGYMKTNNSPTNGGTLCGLTGTNCASGDWTEAYSNLLVQWADFYAQEGVEIDGIAFTNEPDYTSGYESMRFTPAQAAEFTRTFGPIADEAGLDVVCCESFGWEQAKSYWAALQNDPEAMQYVDVLTGHSYASRAQTPFETTMSLWMSEWATSNTAAGWNENWDGGAGVVTDGINTASALQDALIGANATGYLWWLGVSQGASASLLQVDTANDTYSVSSRYYAFSAFSRFIRPDAFRFDAVHSIPGLKVSAYENTDGSQVIQLLNTSQEAISTDVDLGVQPTAYLTSNMSDLEVADEVAVTSGEVTNLELPARSLVTLVVDSDDSGDGIPIEATVPEPSTPGALAMTVADFGDVVTLSEASNAGDRLLFEGLLPEVSVTDSRSADQAGTGGWAVTGQSSSFLANGDELGAEHLGWSPTVLTPRAGLLAGSEVSTVLNSGPGLVSPASLASANTEGRFGSADLSADLLLEVPVDTDPGTYRGTITLSLFPVD